MTPVNIRDELSPAFLARIAEYQRQQQSILRHLAMRREFPRLGRPAQARLKVLIKRRTAAGQWPPNGDEVDTDAELQEALSACYEEECGDLIAGPEFRAVVNAYKARAHTGKVLARAARQRARDLEVKRALLRSRARKVLEWKAGQ